MASAFGSAASLMEHIKWQRRVELFNEGFSFHDQIRWDEGIDLTCKELYKRATEWQSHNG